MNRKPAVPMAGMLAPLIASLLASLLPSPSMAAGKPGGVLCLTPGIPDRVSLRGRYGAFRILVDAQGKSGPVDASERARITLDNPAVATVDEFGTLRPRKDGKTTATVSAGGSSLRIPVEAAGMRYSTPRFTTDVVPVLTRAGCNMGACHGAGSGKGGFKLSLQGYDPDIDYAAIVRASGGRRVVPNRPEQSLFLRKPALAVVHKGGQRFRTGSPEYVVLRDWIASGMPGPSPKEPKVSRLAVIPAVRTLQAGQSQRFAVWAIYNNGEKRDVTSETLFTASDEMVATVTPDGDAKATGPGEGAVLVRYQGLVATARIVSPFATPIRRAPSATEARTPPDAIDHLIDSKLDSLGLSPSPPCTDAEFIRRASLDVTGLLPTPDAVRAFLGDRDPAKRIKLVDRLLESGEYVDFWTLKWGDLLRSSRRLLTDKGMAALNFWIRRAVASNMPWDRFAREILSAQGDSFESGPPNFFRTASTPNELAEATSQTFLGVRIQCARCHNHPYEKWTQNQYYEMAAFFARVRARRGPVEQEQVITAAMNGEVKHPKTAKVVRPCALDDQPVPEKFRGDRRTALAEWITSSRNPFFARCVANRLWKHFMGRGLVEPVDDLRVTNPPSNQELFDFLGQDLASHGFDLKHTMRVILLSRSYQRSAVPTQANARDSRYYSHYTFKRLGAEQLMDAIASATGVPEKLAGYPLGMRAIQLPDTTVPSYFLELFGRPARNITCACERVDDPNLGQILHLMNNSGINGRLASADGIVGRSLRAGSRPDAIVRNIYLAAYSRQPSVEELRRGVRSVGAPPGKRGPSMRGSWIPLKDTLDSARRRRERAEDLLWALMNTREFLFNH